MVLSIWRASASRQYVPSRFARPIWHACTAKRRRACGVVRSDDVGVYSKPLAAIARACQFAFDTTRSMWRMLSHRESPLKYRDRPRKKKRLSTRSWPSRYMMRSPGATAASDDKFTSVPRKSSGASSSSLFGHIRDDVTVVVDDCGIMGFTTEFMRVLYAGPFEVE